MYRCPTCIAALPDPTARRCPMCAQHLRRRRPRVLGEEHRVGARMLPIDPRARRPPPATDSEPRARARDAADEPRRPPATSAARRPR
ncbi:MAG: hypothetical protein KatS3mg010_0181 [Acidimicrobiia bacterium]|nr:MAG: hypothetical protein KatS3mg010_0181 [Acidimicrobiia bacterium]